MQDSRSAPGQHVAVPSAVVAILLAPLAQAHVAIGIAGAAAGLAAVAATRHGHADARTRRLAVFALGLAVLVTLQVPFAVWVVVGALALAARRWAWLRPASGWLPTGTVDRLARAAGAVVVVVAGIALGAWARWTETFGEATLQLADLVRDSELAAVVPVAVVFVVVNAVAEEVAYRGIVQDAVAASWGHGVAVLVQAVAFGVLHVAGFPAGVVGMVLAFVYGLVLGALRVHTGGLRVPVAVHVAADATIAVLVGVLVVPATGAA